ncbi:MAG: DUF3179 domain-containing (seleno)protein [Siphonobacter sp.]
MKALFYLGMAGLFLFELLSVYLIMPMPGSQELDSVDFAYFLYQWRWVFRLAFAGIALAGLVGIIRKPHRWIPLMLTLLIPAALIAYIHFRLSADQMFHQPDQVKLVPQHENKVALNRLVVGITLGKESRAYPIQYLAYHHQVRDTIGATLLMVTYCSVCRTGRVYAAQVDGEPATFRLVGMTHYNALFEDEHTGNWWQQSSGEAIEGPKKGAYLVAIPSEQMTLKQWLALHPASLILQGDPVYDPKYRKDLAYEEGTSRDALTGTDSTSWKNKSWIVGITSGITSKAYDWNRLKRERIINDMIGNTPVVLVLARDNASFVAYQRPDRNATFRVQNDSLVSNGITYDLAGRSVKGRLRALPASQEFWHSWRTIHPKTQLY